MKHKHYLKHRCIFVLALFSLLNNSFAQDLDSLNEANSAEQEGFVFRPTLMLGAGNLTYFGDIASNHGGFHPTVSRMGYEIRLSNPLTDYFDLQFYTIFGTVSSSERSTTRNLNFQSQIRTGGMVISYNFANLLPEKRAVEPYIFTGIESFEFLSKTDIYDKYGNYYYYWDDGSIRNIDQSAGNASSAIIIQRDYHYETDVRESNIDGFGKYPERSWAIPIGVGFNMHLNNRWKFRFGTSMHFSFTDLVDGVTKESVGNRVGNKGNDKFLFTSVAISYDLQRLGIKKKIKPTPFEDDPELLDFLAKDTVDSDFDKVVDFVDDCAWTPAGVPVDEKGCPFDKDKDIVFDYKDDEKATPEGNLVDMKGVTITDDAIYKRFLRYSDTTGEYVEYDHIYEEIYGGSYEKPAAKGVTYVVIIGQEKKSVEATDLRKYLTYSDFKTINQGDTVFYVVGNYKTIEEAIARKNELQGEGIKVDGIAVTDNKGKDPTIEVLPDNKLPKNEDSTSTNTSQIVYRVQIGAFRNKVNPSVFKDVPDLVIVTGADGTTRYYSGSFTDVDKAAEHKVKLLLSGYSGAFIVAYKDYSRLPLEKAGITPAENVNPTDLNPTDVTDVKTPIVDKSQVHYRVQVGAYRNDVPTEVLDVFLEIGNVTPQRDEQGMVRYLSGEYGSEAEANAAKAKIVAMGIKDAFVIGDFNGKIITAEEAKSLLKQ